MEGYSIQHINTYSFAFISSEEYYAELPEKDGMSGNEPNIDTRRLPPELSKLTSEQRSDLGGTMIRDGNVNRIHIDYSGTAPVVMSARFSMTIMAASHAYMLWLIDHVFAPFCNSIPRPWPNPASAKNAGKPVTQYAFSTLTHPLWLSVHGLFYV
jgi:hypothetical protein